MLILWKSKHSRNKTSSCHSLEFSLLGNYFLWASVSVSAKSPKRTARADHKKLTHEISQALAKGKVCFPLCQQNFLIWKESFFNKFPTFKIVAGILGLLHWHNIIWHSLYGKKTNELVRNALTSLYPQEHSGHQHFPTIRTLFFFPFNGNI